MGVKSVRSWIALLGIGIDTRIHLTYYREK